MGMLRLLIVDDIELNRFLLSTMCQKLEGFEIQEAEDGIGAIEIADSWRPHIILMDIMMPRLDGFQASKIIKERYPETIIMAVTAVTDPQMEVNMASIGVVTYIRKPIDQDLIRFKIESFATLLRSKAKNAPSKPNKETVNLFNANVRRFKTTFEIVDSDTMMDFGMWMLERYENSKMKSCLKIDEALEFFYEMVRHGARNKEHLCIIIEESYEEFFVTMKFDDPIQLHPKASALSIEMGDDCIVRENLACVRLRMRDACGDRAIEKIQEAPVIAAPVVKIEAQEPITAVTEPVESKEVRVMKSDENQLLRQSYTQKTAARDYVQDIGGDVLDEIRDLASLDEEWRGKIRDLELEPNEQNVHIFADSVLGMYIHAINNLFEFTALAYALSALSSSLKENAAKIVAEPAILKKLIIFIEHLGADLAAWREHIFETQDTLDIHYLDSSFFSSCVQIEGIVSNKEIQADDDDEMEFF